MSLDRSTVLAMLPCFACGDLPPEQAALVRAALDQDPELREHLAHLHGAMAACEEALGEGALGEGGGDGARPPVSVAEAPVSELERPVRPAASAPPLRVGAALLGLAAPLLLSIGTAATVLGPRPVDALAPNHALAAAADAPGFITQSDPAALSIALRAAGVEPGQAGVGDLSFMGLRLVGGMKAPGDRPGSILVYERDGQRFVCQMYGGEASQGAPAALATVGGHLLRAYQAGPTSVVVWEAFGMICLFSGELPAQELLAVAIQRVGGPAAEG